MFGKSCLVTLATLGTLILSFVISLSSPSPTLSPFIVITGYTLTIWFGSLAVNHALKFWKEHEFVPKKNSPGRQPAKSNPPAILNG